MLTLQKLTPLKKLPDQRSKTVEASCVPSGSGSNPRRGSTLTRSMGPKCGLGRPRSEGELPNPVHATELMVVGNSHYTRLWLRPAEYDVRAIYPGGRATLTLRGAKTNSKYALGIAGCIIFSY